MNTPGNKRILYVGGISEEADLKTVRSAFLPFGNIIDVNLPPDYNTNKHKGFAFVEFQSPEDASDAIDNMDNGEIMGKTIRVNFAKPMKYKAHANRAIWTDDQYLRDVDGGSEATAIGGQAEEEEKKSSNEQDDSEET